VSKEDVVEHCSNCGHAETWHSWGGCQIGECECDYDDAEVRGETRQAPERDSGPDLELIV
jgi:hypothetical protein